MSTAVGTNPVEEFIGKLRRIKGVVDGIKIVPDDFPQDLGSLTRWAVVTLHYTPRHRAAAETLRAIEEYGRFLESLKGPNYQSPPQPSYPSHSLP